jgi:CDP-diacylglycerol--glycerol-3-phosphate 3-phosphatidyltransferase
MLDLVCSLLLLGFLAIFSVVYLVVTFSKSRTPNARLEGYGGVLLGRGVMEAAYAVFEPMVRALAALGVTPNMVTAFALVPGLGSALAVGTGHFGLGALLATMSAFCDLVDGNLARRLENLPRGGEVFDSAVDRYVEFLLLAGLIFYFRTAPVVEVLALAALLGSFMVSYSTAKAEALHVPPPKGAMRRAERAVYLIVGCTMVPVVALVVPPASPGALLLRGPETTVVLALSLVAVVTNVSSVRRLRRIAQEVRARNQAA